MVARVDARPSNYGKVRLSMKYTSSLFFVYSKLYDIENLLTRSIIIFLLFYYWLIYG